MVYVEDSSIEIEALVTEETGVGSIIGDDKSYPQFEQNFTDSFCISESQRGQKKIRSISTAEPQFEQNLLSIQL